MNKYEIKNHQRGFEQDHARIALEVARDWVWPFAYDVNGLLKIHARPDFDPDTWHYCFLEGEMVGCMFSSILPTGESEIPTANLDFPRMLPGHEQGAELLIERAFEMLREKDVARITGRVTTMCPGDVRLAEQSGFSIKDWGYKVYYAYEMEWGKLTFPDGSAQEIDPEKHLDECAGIASKWYQRPADWCRSLLAEWHAEGLITHLGVRENGKLVAACMAAPNEIRPSTAAIYYIYTPDENHLKPMLAKVVNKCIGFGINNVIADLVNEHRPYEPIYQEMGFKKVAEWARCEKELI